MKLTLLFVSALAGIAMAAPVEEPEGMYPLPNVHMECAENVVGLHGSRLPRSRLQRAS